MPQTFMPPAGLKDFDRSQMKDALYQQWHKAMNDQVSAGVQQFPAFYSAIVPPAGAAPKQAAPEWTGLPRTIKRLVGPSIAEAAKLVENARPMGAFDPIDQTKYDVFRDKDGAPFPGPSYRSQDEYLEWATTTDGEGVITEVVFTAEGPEYWDQISQDQKLLLTLYREICQDNSIPLEDLLFSQDVTWRNPYRGDGGLDTYSKGDYNRYNK